MLALARALVGRPRLLLVDELSLGLAPIVVEQLLPVLRPGRRRHRRRRPGRRAARRPAPSRSPTGPTSSSRGQVACTGPAAELADRPDLLEAGYLGP